MLSIASQSSGEQERNALTVCLYSDVHLVLGGMGNGVGAELDVRAGVHRLARAPHIRVQGPTNFFMTIHLRAFPRVCPSSVNSNEAAESVEPGSYLMLASLSMLR